ncbi:MAG: diguanylate cyclase [Candidatus Eremiobacteraeota bacterium]|nr:diguanylate cyclase [Candidatus Eremiobacteraeota bacterium]
MELPNDDAPLRRDADELTRAFLTYVLIPAWLVPGMLDWMWHRKTKIERTAGAHESVTHILMALEAGAGITMGLFLEIDAGVIAAMFASALVHEATAVWDVGYTLPRRTISQAEQHIHSFLEVLPFVGAAFAAFVHPEQTRALLGAGPARPRFAFRLKRTRPPLATVVAVAASGLFGVAPYVEELVRCLRVEPTVAPQPLPPDHPSPKPGI